MPEHPRCSNLGDETVGGGAGLCGWNNGMVVQVILQKVGRNVAEELQPLVVANAFLVTVEPAKNVLKPWTRDGFPSPQIMHCEEG